MDSIHLVPSSNLGSGKNNKSAVDDSVAWDPEFRINKLIKITIYRHKGLKIDIEKPINSKESPQSEYQPYTRAFSWPNMIKLVLCASMSRNQPFEEQCSSMTSQGQANLETLQKDSAGASRNTGYLN